MSRTFCFVISCLKSVYGTFTGALALGRKYRMRRMFAARIARNVIHARRGGMVGGGVFVDGVGVLVGGEPAPVALGTSVACGRGGPDHARRRR
jgi:hypothetical protein